MTWLLTDIQPERDALKLVVSKHSWPFVLGFPDRYWATITVNSLHVGAKQWTALRAGLREYLGISKAKPFTGKDQELLEAISRQGGVPQQHGRKMQFWEQLFQEYGSEFPNWRSAHTPRLQYRRINEKLTAVRSISNKGQ